VSLIVIVMMVYFVMGRAECETVDVPLCDGGRVCDEMRSECSDSVVSKMLFSNNATVIHNLK